MVDLVSGQGRSDFVTAGVAALRRGLQRARTPARVERCRFWADTLTLNNSVEGLLQIPGGPLHPRRAPMGTVGGILATIELPQ